MSRLGWLGCLLAITACANGTFDGHVDGVTLHVSSVALVTDYTPFTIHDAGFLPATQCVEQAVVVMADVPDVCEDLQTGRAHPNKVYFKMGVGQINAHGNSLPPSVDETYTALNLVASDVASTNLQTLLNGYAFARLFSLDSNANDTLPNGDGYSRSGHITVSGYSSNGLSANYEFHLGEDGATVSGEFLATPCALTEGGC